MCKGIWDVFRDAKVYAESLANVAAIVAKVNTIRFDTNDSGVENDDVTVSEECSVCCQTIILKYEGLPCEGQCNRWMHCCCAVIPISYFKMYIVMSSPFYCYSCCHQRYNCKLANLKEEIVSLRKEVINFRQKVTESCRDNSSNMPPLAKPFQALKVKVQLIRQMKVLMTG